MYVPVNDSENESRRRRNFLFYFFLPCGRNYSQVTRSEQGIQHCCDIRVILSYYKREPLRNLTIGPEFTVSFGFMSRRELNKHSLMLVFEGGQTKKKPLKMSVHYFNATRNLMVCSCSISISVNFVR